MYSELYSAWQREIESSALQPLPPDFFARLSDYLTRIKEECMAAQDRTTVKASLLERERQYVNRIVKELLEIRFRKLEKTFDAGQKLPDLLTSEEAGIFAGLIPIADAYRKFVEGLLQGEKLKAKQEISHKIVALRFLKSVPAIIGSDLQTYGPFLAEDVASVPVDNAKILVKQGFAEIIEVS